MDAAIARAGLKIGYKNIRPQQEQVIKAYCEGNDVFFCAPTGSGKSLTFEVAADLLGGDDSKILIISPLVSLMTMQAKKLRDMGVNAAYIGGSEDPDTMSELPITPVDQAVSSGARVWVASPETCLGSLRDAIEAEAERFEAVFVDEAHCVLKYGLPDKQRKTKAFRPLYARIGEIRSVLGRKPVICLTATATEQQQNLIIKHLGMKKTVIVKTAPVKNNITYHVCTTGNGADIDDNFAWLLHLLRSKERETPRMLVFFRRLNFLADVYAFLKDELQGKALGTFEMFHMKTDHVVKERIIKSFVEDGGLVRVVLCSTSFSMGLDLRDVPYVVHYGPSNDQAGYLQETGRAARDIEVQGQAVILAYKRSTGSVSISAEMKQFVKTVECRRQILVKPFLPDAENLSMSPGHLCCDNCRKQCECGACPELDGMVPGILDPPCDPSDDSDSDSMDSDPGHQSGYESPVDSEEEGDSDASMRDYLERKGCRPLASYSSEED